MRYFTVTYYRKSDGRMDESVTVRSSLRPKHFGQCGVIVDFRHRRVLKASVEGTAIPLDFDRVVGYYIKFHRQIIKELAQYNGYDLIDELDDETKDTGRDS